MSDEFPDEQELSKRERQKQRRQRKLEEQRVQERRARRRRTLVTAVIALLLLGATGAFAAQWALNRAEERRLIAESEENLEAIGCTPVEEQPILGREHFNGPELAEFPPDAVYPDRPTTSGIHIGQWAITGVYDKVIDERLLIHNLEHGYVNLFYAVDAPEDDVARLKQFAQEQIDSRRHEKLIVAGWKADLPGETQFALTAWGARQLCEQFDEGVALSFLREYHYLAGDAPEKELSPHLEPGSGVDPTEAEGDLLFPPLDEDPDVEGETMEEGQDIGDGAGDNGEEGDGDDGG